VKCAIPKVIGMHQPAPAVLAPPGIQTSFPLEDLTPQERAVYAVLASEPNRVRTRHEIARSAGISDLNQRRCDSLIVGIRRVVGSDRLITVRRRGYLLLIDA
jgi:DNA-binding response OmpR family regulator